MLTTIILSLLLHLPGQKEPVELIPGEIWVIYRDSVTPEQRKVFEQSLGLPEPETHGIPVRIREWCAYKIPKGHEQFWEMVLNDSANADIVWKAMQAEQPPRPPTAGFHQEGTLRMPIEKSMKKPFKQLSISFAEMLDAKISQYFRDNYKDLATVSKRGENSLELSIDKMKGRVIAKPHYWERLNIYVVFFQTKDENEARLYVDYDGCFAPGIGSTPPPDESYSSMDNRYDWALSRYAGKTTTGLKSYLEKVQ